MPPGGENMRAFTVRAGPAGDAGTSMVSSSSTTAGFAFGSENAMSSVVARA